jgi:hypothetical protein
MANRDPKENEVINYLQIHFPGYDVITREAKGNSPIFDVIKDYNRIASIEILKGLWDDGLGDGLIHKLDLAGEINKKTGKRFIVKQDSIEILEQKE